MACAIIGRLMKRGMSPQHIDVVEPFEPARVQLGRTFGIQAQNVAGSFLEHADLVLWAVKPQIFQQAAIEVAPYTSHALHLSVAAGIRSQCVAAMLGTERVVRAMPNTPALIGMGVSGLFARSGVSQADRIIVIEVMTTTGRLLWLDSEEQLDSVTALSGSGPAYVFYFMEAMITAGVQMGLSWENAQLLTLATFSGASELACSSSDSPGVLRQRVTSQGGTTHAALLLMEQNNIGVRFIDAMTAAHARAKALGDEFCQPEK